MVVKGGRRSEFDFYPFGFFSKVLSVRELQNVSETNGNGRRWMRSMEQKDNHTHLISALYMENEFGHGHIFPTEY
jgi:hypothetical protein